jgi:hypothetical protein
LRPSGSARDNTSTTGLISRTARFSAHATSASWIVAVGY